MTTAVVSSGRLRKTVRRLGLLVAGVVCGTAGICKAQQAKSAKPSVQKDTAIRKLQPGDVAGLPPEFVDKLNARGCSIPQFGEIGPGGDTEGESATAGEPASAGKPTNVIHGEFARRGQEDWAVLCSK